MADRTSARLFGEVFTMLAELKANPESVNADDFALSVWRMKERMDCDFSDYQMGADDSLTALGLRCEPPGEVDDWDDTVVLWGEEARARYATAGK